MSENPLREEREAGQEESQPRADHRSFATDRSGHRQRKTDPASVPRSQHRQRKRGTGLPKRVAGSPLAADRVRGLFKEVDSATVEIISPSGCEGGPGGAVAEISSVGTWQPGENQEHHERRVQPCHSLGMGDTQSHHPGSAECQAEKGPDRPDDRADQGVSFKPERALSNCGLARCVKRPASRRVTWPQMAGRGLQIVGGKRHSVRGQAEDHSLQNGGLPEADSTRCGIGGSPVQLEASMPVSTTGRLGVCQSTQERQTAVLARLALSRSPQTGAQVGGNSWQRGMAYAATHVRHFDESEWRGHQDHTGAVAPFKLQGDGGYLHPCGDTNQTSRTDQIGENDLARTGKSGHVLRANCSYWTFLNPRHKRQFSLSTLVCWRPRRDLNPCYRRERGLSCRITLYLQGTGRSVRPCKEPLERNQCVSSVYCGVSFPKMGQLLGPTQAATTQRYAHPQDAACETPPTSSERFSRLLEKQNEP